VAVAGVSALAHVLGSELDAAALGLYALLFLAFWLSWTTFMLYSNVAAGQTRVIRLLIGMFGLGAMAASVPDVAHTVLRDGDSVRPLTVFTIAYLATRIYGAQSWRRGDVLLDFPVAQSTVGLLPWFVSFWVDEPWKLALWAVGVGLDLLLILVLSGHQILEQFQTKFSAQATSRRWPRAGAGSDGEAPAIHVVSVDPGLLSERLGLFVIIVLGESVVQIVNAVSAARYSVGLLATAIASFVLLAGLFGLSVVFGYAGLPHLRAGRIPTRAALGLHCLVTGVVATVAVSLALVVEHGSDPGSLAAVRRGRGLLRSRRGHRRRQPQFGSAADDLAGHHRHRGPAPARPARHRHRRPDPGRLPGPGTTRPPLVRTAIDPSPTPRPGRGFASPNPAVIPSLPNPAVIMHAWVWASARCAGARRGWTGRPRVRTARRRSRCPGAEPAGS
jgi:low temperature requirement protein LtrA